MESTVTVYEFEEFDAHVRRWRKAQGMATAEAIERAGGVVLKLTALVVDASRVNEEGHVEPLPRSEPATK